MFFLGTLLAGFLAGVGTYQGALKLIDYEAVRSKPLQSIKEALANALVNVDKLQKELELKKTEVSVQRWLRIKGVQALDETTARVVAYVNGRAISYPSRTVWSRLRAGLPPEDFPLPSSSKGYDISFQLLAVDLRGGFQQFGSQQVLEVRQQTFDGSYELFPFGVATGGASECGSRSVPRGSTRGVPTCGSGVATKGVVQVQFEIR